MPTDPSDPKSPSLYQTTSTASKGGGGGIVFVILLLLVVGGGAAYYFLVSKPAIATIPAPTPATTAPTASTGAPAPVATPAPVKTGYDNATRQKYLQTAVDAFKALRQSRYQPFADAFSAFSTAGGFSAASLTSKEAIAARRDLVKKCLAANDDYAAFVKDQEAAYTAELKKTPLTPNDVEVDASLTGAKMPTDKMIQLRTLQNESLKTGDQMLEYLDSKFGAWSVNADKHIVFKKSADGAPFTTLAKSYSEQVVALNKLRDEVNANESVDPTAASAAAGAASPAAAPSAAAPSATP